MGYDSKEALHVGSQYMFIYICENSSGNGLTCAQWGWALGYGNKEVATSVLRGSEGAVWV